MQGNRDRGKKTASTDLPAVYCGGKACPYISLPHTPLEWEPLALGLPYRLKSQATTEPNTPIQSSTADSKHLSGHNSISQHNSVLGRGTYIHMDGERSPFFAGWWCGRCLTAIPPSAGAPPPVATRRCPSASILVGDIAPSSAAISLCPSSSSSRPAPRTKTRTNPAGIKSPPNRAESNPRERHEPRTIRAEQASGAPVEIGGGGAATGAAEAGADLTPGVAFPPRGGVASGERPREEEGSARGEGGEGEFLLLFIALTPRCDG